MKHIKQIKKLKTHVILCNLGGVNSRNEVRRFLFNLFRDKYIIPLPFVFRTSLAFLISTVRFKKSTKEYDKIGGKSPILENTHAQADALVKSLQSHGEFEIHVAMRYNHPFIKDVLEKISQNYKGEKIIFLPLYPQFSLTTSQSAIKHFENHTEKLKIYNVESVRYFHKNPKYIESCKIMIQKELDLLENSTIPTVILFSAHGIPEDFITKKKDLYRTHIEETMSLIMAQIDDKVDGMDGCSIKHELCFQSRVGPKQWLKPYIQNVIPKYSGYNMVVFPIAFVSEHLETLVELDIEYAHMAKKCGVVEYRRAKTPSIEPNFIECLADEILKRYQAI